MTRRSGGSRWRILVHEWLPQRQGSLLYGTSHSIASSAELAGKESEHRKPQVLADTEFDELVVGHWLHIEQMSDTVWWMNVAGVNINVTVKPDGKPHYVTVEAADKDDWPGCVYRYED